MTENSPNNSEASPENPFLHEWNRLNIYNSEQLFISTLISSLSDGSPEVDTFSMWLLAGTGATAAVLITNMSNILPFLGEEGFRWCGGFLLISALFGFLAKGKAVAIMSSKAATANLESKLSAITQNYEEQRKKIEESALAQNIEIQTHMDDKKLLPEYYKVMPWGMKIMLWYYSKRFPNERQRGPIIVARAFIWQARFTWFQSMTYMGFILSGVYWATLASP